MFHENHIYVCPPPPVPQYVKPPHCLTVPLSLLIKEENYYQNHSTLFITDMQISMDHLSVSLVRVHSNCPNHWDFHNDADDFSGLKIFFNFLTKYYISTSSTHLSSVTNKVCTGIEWLTACQVSFAGILVPLVKALTLMTRNSNSLHIWQVWTCP